MITSAENDKNISLNALHNIKQYFIFFRLCSSYPKLHIVPSHITDKKLDNIAKFRASRRFPSAVWRYGIILYTVEDTIEKLLN